MGIFLSLFGSFQKEKLPPLKVVTPVDRAAVFDIKYESSDDESSDDSLFSVQSEPIDIPIYSCPEMRRCVSEY